MSEYTHYQAFRSTGEDAEVELGTPFVTKQEAVDFAEERGEEYFFVYQCYEVTANCGTKWWFHSSSPVYTSF